MDWFQESFTDEVEKTSKKSGSDVPECNSSCSSSNCDFPDAGDGLQTAIEFIDEFKENSISGVETKYWDDAQDSSIIVNKWQEEWISVNSAAYSWPPWHFRPPETMTEEEKEYKNLYNSFISTYRRLEGFDYIKSREIFADSKVDGLIEEERVYMSFGIKREEESSMIMFTLTNDKELI